MNNENYFKDIFEAIPDCRKIVFLIFIIQKDKDLLNEVGFSERDIICLSEECKKLIIEKHEKYLDYVENEEESIIEKFLNKYLEQYFSNLFEDVKH